MNKKYKIFVLWLCIFILVILLSFIFSHFAIMNNDGYKKMIYPMYSFDGDTECNEKYFIWSEKKYFWKKHIYLSTRCWLRPSVSSWSDYIKIPHVDINSFTVISRNYAYDIHRVYLRQRHFPRLESDIVKSWSESDWNNFYINDKVKNNSKYSGNYLGY
jgi:hypothetical protein